MNLRRLLFIGALCGPIAPSFAFAQAPAAAEDDDDTPDPARPPSAGKGVVWGVVKHEATKEPVIEAQVTVTATQMKVQADLDGRYRLELPPGTYELRVWYEGFKAQRLKNVVVAGGKVNRLDVALPPDGNVVEEVVEIDVTPDRASPTAQIELRRSAAHAGDAISAQDVAKSPDRNAADAARRVVGATLVGGRYLFVRGLGERYANTLLNGTPLPSPEPDRQAVPLDIFPSLVLSDINLAKTATPDMPGDFAGGSVRINTRELPRAFFVQANAWIGADTQATFAKRLSYDGSNMDWLGVDGGARGFPSNVPSYKIGRGLVNPSTSAFITPEELTAYGRTINSTMVARPVLTAPNMRANLAIGDTFKLAGGQELGVIAAVTYGRRFQRRTDELLRNYYPDPEEPGELRSINDYRVESGTDLVNWSTYGSVTWAPDTRNKLTATGLHNRSSTNEARVIQGWNEERQAELTDTRLRFESRSLTFGELSGAHKIKAAGDGLLRWAGFLAHATSDEPDTRETVYVHDEQLGVDAWDRGTQSGYHFWGKQRETSYGGMLDWTQPLIKGEKDTKLKAGALVNRKARTFDARRLRFVNRAGTPAEVYNLPADQLFTKENIGTALEIEEYTRANDAYTAGWAVYSGYLMVDAWVLPRLRVTTGARLEAAQQSLDSFDPFAAELTRKSVELNKTDLLPSINVVVKVAKQANLRMAATRTVARPQLRELSPFLFTDYFGAFDVVGNPELRRTSIYNGDVRLEVFPAAGEVLAVSGFYKQFYAPIERVILPSNQGTVTFQNSDSARVAGIELEARKGLGFIHGALRDVTLLANFTLASSTVKIDPRQSAVMTQQTNNERRLQGQSPWVVNAGLDFSPDAWGLRARLLYNVFGPRISEVGANGAPDVMEEPRHQLDLYLAKAVGKHVELKFTAENMLDAVARFTQTTKTQSFVVNQYRNGATLFFGVEYTN